MPFPISPLRTYSKSLMTEETLRLRRMWDETEEGYRRPLDQFDTEFTKSYGLPLGATERIEFNRAGYVVDEKRFLPIGTDVEPDDLLQVGDDVYEIVSILRGTEALQPHISVLVRRIESEGGE